MNILLICDEYPPGRHGGIGSAVHMLAHTYKKMGHNVVVAGFYAPGYGGEDYFDDDGVIVHRFRQKISSSFFKNADSLLVRAVSRLLNITGVFYWSIKMSMSTYGNVLNKLITDYKINIVEMPDYNDYIRFCKRPVYFPKLNAPIIVKLHGSMTYFNREAGVPTPDYIRKTEQSILNNAHAVVSVSKYTAEKSAEYLDYKRPIKILYNGIEVPTLPTINGEQGMVIFTGTLVAKKGIYQLIKAWNSVTEKIHNAQLHIYGKGEIEKLKALLSKKANNTVKFKGHVDRSKLLLELYKAEVAVFPSYAECFAISPMEAMVVGTAVIYSTRTSGPELISDGETGFLVDPDNVTELADRIVNLLTDDALRNKIGVKGKAHIENNFNIEHIANEHIQFYKKVIEQQGEQQ